MEYGRVKSRARSFELCKVQGASSRGRVCFIFLVGCLVHGRRLKAIVMMIARMVVLTLLTSLGAAHELMQQSHLACLMHVNDSN